MQIGKTADFHKEDMEKNLSDIEYINTDATAEQVKAAIRSAKVIMQRPLPLTHELPKNACIIKKIRRRIQSLKIYISKGQVRV